MTLRRLHRLNAAALAVFLLIHLGNHAVIIGGTDAHLAAQSVLAPIYRVLPVQLLLLAAFGAQIALGLALLKRGRGRTAGWRRAQALSGLVLAGFLLIHVSATLAARASGLDTTVHFAAGGMFHPIGRLWFALYYPAAIAALATHIAAWLALRRRLSHRAALTLCAAGLAFGAAVTLGLGGAFGGPRPPAEYLWSGSTL